MKILFGVLVLAIIMCAICVERYTIQNNTTVVGPHGQPFRVHALHSDHERAARVLSASHRNVIELLRRMRDRYIRSPLGDAHPARRAMAEKLMQRYSVDTLVENSPLNPLGDTSFTVRKGKVLALCIREKQSGRSELHSANLVTFVHFHEMAHLAIDDLQHPPRFWQAFKLLLLEAEDAGIITTPDYRRQPVAYCGMNVNYNPRYDPTIAPL